MVRASVILSSEMDVPREGMNEQRGAGVAIVSLGPAWRAGGIQWKAWGLRLVTATPDTGRKGVGSYVYCPALHPQYVPLLLVERRTDSSTPSRMPERPHL